MENYFGKYLEVLRNNNDNPKAPEVIRFVMRFYREINYDISRYEPIKLYKYMITFTLDPSKNKALPFETLRSEVEQYIVKLLNTKENLQFYYCLEHPDTNAHWHTVIYRETTFRQDTVRYYKKKYGNVDISKSFDLSNDHTLKYLGKESDIIFIKGNIEITDKKEDNQPLNLT